jgi:hypothetical protein
MLQIYSCDLTYYSNGEWMEAFLSGMQCLLLYSIKSPPIAIGGRVTEYIMMGMVRIWRTVP